MPDNTGEMVEVKRGHLEYVQRVVERARRYHRARDEAEDIRHPRELLYSELTTSLSTAAIDLQEMLKGDENASRSA